MVWNRSLHAAAALVLACTSMIPQNSRAGIITTFSELPPFGTYASSGHTFAGFLISSVPFPISITTAAHTPAPPSTVRRIICPPVPLPCIMDSMTPGFMEEETFDSEGSFGIVLPGSTIEKKFPLIRVITRIKLLSNLGGVKEYSNELVSLEIPMFDLMGMDILLREDQDDDKKSTGMTTIKDLGGGLFRIDSFFDVFTELSLDHGRTWNDCIVPAGQPACGRVVLVPEPGTLALVGAAFALLGWAGRCRPARRVGVARD